VFSCSNKVGVGHIRHLDYGQITLEDMLWLYTDKMRQIANDFASAGISMELAEDLLLGRWKIGVEYSYNGLSVILNARTDELMSHVHTRKLVEQLMYEVAAVSKSCGRIILIASFKQCWITP